MLKRLLFAALVGLPLAAVTATAYAGPETEDRPLHQRERVAGTVESEQGRMLTVRTRGGESVDLHWSASMAKSPPATRSSPATAWRQAARSPATAVSSRPK